MATSSYVQVPPDSTGKKLASLEHSVGGSTVQGQVFHLADPDEIGNKQAIDYRGAASVRFSEGSPLSDAFGNLKVSQKSTVGMYDFVGDPNDVLFSDTLVGGGTLEHLPFASTMVLATGMANGDFVSRVTNKYHYYMPGTGNLITMTVALSDAYTDGCERRWGAFDSTCGIYFSLDDLGALKAVCRTNVSGTVVNNHVTRELWNGDKCDGTGDSGYVLDLTKLNIYWWDYQWLGAGRVRYGVVDDYGNRIVCHTMLNAGHNLFPYMRSGTLPLQVNIENKRATGAACNIRWTCASVQTEGAADYTYWRYTYDFPATPVTTNTHLISLKSKSQMFGAHNITNAYPESFNFYITGGDVRIDAYWDTLPLTGGTFALDNGSTVLADVAGTLTFTGNEYRFRTGYFMAGAHIISLLNLFDKLDEGLVAKANESEPEYITFVATSLSGTPSILGSVCYAELR